MNLLQRIKWTTVVSRPENIASFGIEQADVI